MNRRPDWPPAFGRAAPQVSRKLMMLAAERSDEQAAGLAASLWSGRALGKREAAAPGG
jgi:hypothetical protein